MSGDTDGIPRPSQDDADYLRNQRDTGSELERSEGDERRAVNAAGVPGLGAVRSLINATYFNDLLCHIAYKRFKHEAPEARVAAMVAAHPKFAQACRVADWLYRAAAASVLLGTLTAVAAGTIFRVFFS